jgi:hypothetical protein
MTRSILNPAAAEAAAPQAWLSSARWDLLFIIAPAFLVSAIAVAFPVMFENSSSLPLWAWVSFVLLVDVAHVYATLFRTYLDKLAFEQNKTVLLVIPTLCWVVGSLLYSLDGLLFWKALAYLAVFHFIRQQYGFVVLYSRKQPTAFDRFKWLDHALVYMATVYPMMFWHTHLPRNFNWFVEGDFIESIPQVVTDTTFGIYAIVAFLYAAKELLLLRSTGYFNVPKNLLILGTALSWWIGIVMLNSDMAFTMTNVVSHGVPYMALIWLMHHQRGTVTTSTDQAGFYAPEPETASNPSTASTSMTQNTPWLQRFTKVALTYAPVFLLFLIGLAYLEEGLWDGFIWREHTAFFAAFSHLPEITEKTFLAILIPSLALPQSTHYVLDGFIWRMKDKSNAWSLWRPSGKQSVQRDFRNFSPEK